MTINVDQALPKSGRFVYSLYRFIWYSLDLIFPPNCGGCGRVGTRWCQDCNDKVITLLPTCCPVCGQKQNDISICSRCRLSRPTYSHLRSWAVFNDEIRNAIHKLKYQNDISLAEILSRPLITLISGFTWSIDIVIPVPLSDIRKKDRGYNQAALIAFPIALAMGMKYRPTALRRVRDTESQVGLTYLQRHENVNGAFLANTKVVNARNVLIVDDVTTSGATLNACADALRLAQAKNVYAVTLARALYN